MHLFAAYFLQYTYLQYTLFILAAKMKRFEGATKSWFKET